MSGCSSRCIWPFYNSSRGPGAWFLPSLSVAVFEVFGPSLEVSLSAYPSNKPMPPELLLPCHLPSSVVACSSEPPAAFLPEQVISLNLEDVSATLGPLSPASLLGPVSGIQSVRHRSEKTEPSKDIPGSTVAPWQESQVLEGFRGS